MLDASDALAIELCHYYQTPVLTGGQAAPTPAPKRSPKANDWASFTRNKPDKIR